MQMRRAMMARRLMQTRRAPAQRPQLPRPQMRAGQMLRRAKAMKGAMQGRAKAKLQERRGKRGPDRRHQL
jgi:hypothetical protein